VCIYTTHHLLELLPIKLAGLGEVLARNPQTSEPPVYLVYETTRKGTLQNSYLAIFGDDVEVVARYVDMRANIFHAPLELGKVEA
jgi:hypothetical protein